MGTHDCSYVEAAHAASEFDDEQIPLSWIDNIKDRLLTHSEKTLAWIDDWKALLA